MKYWLYVDDPQSKYRCFTLQENKNLLKHFRLYKELTDGSTFIFPSTKFEWEVLHGGTKLLNDRFQITELQYKQIILQIEMMKHLTQVTQ